jgi:raffinose/stachyose/melibiose transport system permease protein
MQSETPKKQKPFPTHIIVFLAPAVIVYTIFMIIPLADYLRVSFLAADTGQFVGLQNYRTLLTDNLWSDQFWNAFRNNVQFFLIHMVVQNSIALFLAALLSRRSLRGTSVYRTVFFMPTVLSVVIIGFIWQLILSPLWRITEGFMGFFGLEHYFQPWLG